MNRLKVENIFIAASSVQTALGRQGCRVFVSNLSKIRRVTNRVNQFLKYRLGERVEKIPAASGTPSVRCPTDCPRSRQEQFSGLTSSEHRATVALFRLLLEARIGTGSSLRPWPGHSAGGPDARQYSHRRKSRICCPVCAGDY